MPFDADTMSSAPTLTFVGGLITDTFDVSFADVDIFAVTLTAGRMYEFDVDGGNDSYLRLFDFRGREIKANDDGADNGEALALQPYTQLHASYTGTYYVALSPYYLTDYDPATTDGRISPQNPLAAAVSTLNVTDNSIEFFPDANSINAITQNGPSDGSNLLGNSDGSGRQRIEYFEATSVTSADIEMGRFDLRKGDRVVVDVNGYVPGSIDNLFSIIRVFNSAGTQIAFDSGSGADEDSELVFAAPSAGAYYIAVSGQGNGSYNALDGSGALASDTGFFTPVLHLNPTLVGSSAAQTLNGTAGDDYIVLMAGSDTSAAGAGADIVSGGDDNDTINGDAGNDDLYGDAGNDILNGDNDDDTLDGGYGNDTLNGGSGTDIANGGAGNDTVFGGAGNDAVYGDAGNDTLRGTNGNDTLFGGDDADGYLGGDANDDIVYGGTGNDRVDGALDNDTLFGDADHDFVTGGDGNDALYGGTGNDILYGNAGNDFLHGGLGRDTLYGHAGNDTFEYLTADFGGAQVETIYDFAEVGGSNFDTLRLQGAALDYQFYNGAGFVRVYHTASGGSVYVNNMTAATIADQIVYF